MVALLVVLTALVGPGAVAVTPAQAQLLGRSEIVIRVDLDNRQVLVSETIHPATSGHALVWVPVEATEVTSDASIVARRDQGPFVELEISSPDGATVTYALPSAKGRASDGTRVNGAMVGFSLWPNAEVADITVELPQGFVANVGGAFVPRLVAEDTLHYVATEIDTLNLWGFWFVAFRDSGLVTRQVDIGDDTIEVAGWADDPAWLDMATRYVGRGVPTLVELIGQPWPEDDLRVVESVAPAQVGYAGWYDPSESEIEIPDSLDPDTMLHELSHAWFNSYVFEERWMVEGFAEAYASQARLALDGEAIEATRPDPHPPGFEGLNDWRQRLYFEGWEYEYHGYQTSFWVVDQLIAEIGVEGMAAALDAMFDKRHPYALEDETLSIGGNDWRRFLDLLERQGSSATAEELFAIYVLTPEQLQAMEPRRQTLDRYDAMAGGHPERVPEAIRVALAEWAFTQANTLMDDADAIQIELAALADRAAAHDLPLPPYLTELYLSADSGFGVVHQAVDDTSAALTAVENNPDALDDEARRNFSLGRYERMGLDLDATSPAGGLNQGDDEGSSNLVFLAVLVVLGLFLLVAFIVFVQVASRPPPPRNQEEAKPAPEPAARS